MGREHIFAAVVGMASGLYLWWPYLGEFERLRHFIISNCSEIEKQKLQQKNNSS
jgi:hypothetical protein